MAGEEDKTTASGATWFPGEQTDEPVGPAGPVPELRYIEASEVGRGSMGRVLGVQDAALGRRVAYKVMRRKHDSPAARQRFLREAQITTRLEHPGIAPVYDMGAESDGHPGTPCASSRARAWNTPGLQP